jgi:hypothetical protein
LKKIAVPAARTGLALRSRLESALLLLIPVALWIWLCRDWPARLGFYSDDWMILLHPFVGTAGAFHDILNLVVTRPVSAPYIWLAQVIVDWSPVRSQVLNALMLLMTAASVGKLTSALVSASRLREGALVAACAAAASFIVFPSIVGTFAWGVGVTTAIPVLPLFCSAMCLLLKSEDSWRRLGLGLLVSLLSHLSYEAFYFQEITLILMAATLRTSMLRDIPWRALLGVILINIACVVYNRSSTGIIHKTFHWEFIQIFIGGYPRILDILGHAVREHVSLTANSLLVAGLSGSMCLARQVGALRVPIWFAVTICGIIGAGLLYAFAGYGLAVEGPMARVAIVLATYCSVTAGVLAAAARCAVAKHRLAGSLFSVSAGICLVALTLTARARVGEWADAWSYEVARLARLPAAMTSIESYVAGDERLYVVIEDRPASFVEPAIAPWEISGAIAWASYKITNSRLPTVDVWKMNYRRFATPLNWFNRWDGHRFEQGVCASGPALYGNFGSELWSWNSSTGAFSKINAPWENGC